MTATHDQTERRIAAALAARAGGITMGTSTLEERFAEVQARGVRDRRRRRGTAVGAAALATAAAVLGAFAIGAGVLRDDDAPMADRERAVLGEPVLVGSGTPDTGTTYTVEQFPVPFTVEVPDKGDVPGRWHYGIEDGTFSVGLDASPSTGFASVVLDEQTEIYDPSRPWTEQDALVEAPRTAQDWEQWFEDTGFAEVGELERTTVGGVPATRMRVDVADDLPDAYDGCSPRDGCLATHPIGPGEVGSGFQAGLPAGGTAEVTVLEVDGRTLVATASGAAQTRDDWLPLMRSVVESLRFA